MPRLSRAIIGGVLAAVCLGVAAYAQQPSPPPFATTKVDGTDNVYIFRYGGHQSMFIVTPQGVIATDPISERRPAAKAYIEEIEKITKAPIKYVIYSHSHFDHIAGGKPFKDKGAVFVAHQNAKTRIQQVKDPDVVVPDQVVTGAKRNITLGGTTLELNYVGKNHSNSTLVMRLPKDMIDFYPLEAEDSMKKVLAMDWDKLIPGHPGAPNGRLGTKQDVQDQLTFLQDASAAVKAEAQAGKCWDPVEKDLKLPKYENWAGYAQNLPFVLRRYCALWGRGT